MPEQVINSNLTEQEKVVSLFQFIRELNKLKQKAILNMREYPWSFALSNLPDDPMNISVHYPDRVEEDEAGDSLATDEILLSVHKPEFKRCPEPDELFSEWLLPGWDNYKRQAEVLSQREVVVPSKKEIKNLFEAETQEEPDTELIFEFFADDEARVKSYTKWLDQRDKWVEKQKICSRTRNLFTDLYRMYFELQRESETEEIIAANGMLRDRDNSAICHPVLTHRVKLDYDPEKNTVYIKNTDTLSELYSIAFQVMEDVNLNAINTLSADLQENDYHPLDRNDTPGFLKVLAHQLSSDSIYSESGVLENWKAQGRILMYNEPCFIVRKRLDGTLKAIEQIIENVQETGEIPAPIRDIVSGGTIDIPEDTGEESIEEQLAAVGGESAEILLSKEANKEQLEIAHRIEYYNAVLVQGPPGTGKTHTIANLMGHFLAQGKSVLVTSHTTKALSVLKEKVAPGLQSLCVSILDDSNVDMERSVDGITDYMAKTTSHELKREMDVLAVERRQLIEKLADVRRKIFLIINQECNCIVYNGEEISPSKAAEFIVNNAEALSYIPGKVRLRAPMPLTFAELTDLYRSNELVSAEDELELAAELPKPEQILSPAVFANTWTALQNAKAGIETAAVKSRLSVINDIDSRIARFDNAKASFALNYPDSAAIKELKDYVGTLGKIEDWMKYAAVDGKSGGAYRLRWLTLIDKIKETCEYAESVVTEQFGNNIVFADSENIQVLKGSYEGLKTAFSDKGKISKFTFWTHKDFEPALNAVTINGKHPNSAENCDIVLHCIELDAIRKECAKYWNELLGEHGVPDFFSLDRREPEKIAGNWIPHILRYLDWYETDYEPLKQKMSAIGLPIETVFDVNSLDSDLAATEKILSAAETIIPSICDICNLALVAAENTETLKRSHEVLLSGKRSGSETCKNVERAMAAGNESEYSDSYAVLERMHEKYALQAKRDEMLKTLEPIAPQWAEAIRNRAGIHGSDTVPNTIEEAYKWKQLSGIIEEITAQPFGQFQAESLHLSKEYRKITAKYAEKSGWYHLLRQTEADINMKQALQGWKLTVKKIGKGTGKQAPALKAEARKLMAKCQGAVPGWIMPINRALESLDPKRNRFDVVIIDEASQSDISSLAILYMGKKLIIVGDDKQVSPMAVGMEVDKMDALQQMYIKEKIPNAHLYNGKTSIYDIAATTFQPLMLREHFRCVPEIIGFSNMLSYDFKIMPLRDASNSVLLPAVVNYRVTDGKRDDRGKTNKNEAKAIVALMKACMEQPEYKNKTFGVISLLGDEQFKLIQQMIEEQIDHKEIKERNILCGNSANFQGDERDVIFLSLVDSGDGNGPVHLLGFGTDDATRKRYNVAASRARDQLWVVDSLDSAVDLKPGDIRKTLIDYSLNPNSVEISKAEIEEKADSPFEVAVATSLKTRGYHLVQQWKVGAYRLDMVAVFGKKTVAIECDGERWHSGEAKIREDMERQTILERLGWRFIRIRGSEYYKDPEKTMTRVVSELTNYGIEPESISETSNTISRDTELLSRVKQRAAIILYGEGDTSFETIENTIAGALGTTEISIENAEIPEKPLPGSMLKPFVPSIEKTEKIEVISTKTADLSSTEPVVAEKQKSDSTELKTVKKSERAQKIGKPTSNETKDNSSKKVKSKTEKSSIGIPVIQEVIPGMEDMLPESEDIISLLKKNSVKYIDKRSSNGALWIVGGKELNDVVQKAKPLGYSFKFKEGGGKQTQGKDGWWTK